MVSRYPCLFQFFIEHSLNLYISLISIFCKDITMFVHHFYHLYVLSHSYMGINSVSKFMINYGLSIPIAPLSSAINRDFYKVVSR